MASESKRTRSTFGKIIEATTPKIIDLPASSADPTIIEIPARATQIIFIPHAEMHFSWGASAVAASAKEIIDNDTDRGKLPIGLPIVLPVAGASVNMYVRSTGGAATDGLTYFFAQED